MISDPQLSVQTKGKDIRIRIGRQQAGVCPRHPFHGEGGREGGHLFFFFFLLLKVSFSLSVSTR